MSAPLFPRNLQGVMHGGVDSYATLPQVIRDMHDVQHEIVAEGKASLVRDQTFLARVAARVFRFPKEGSEVPVVTTFTATAAGETLHRNFAGECFSTYFYDYPRAGYFIERFGPFWFLIENHCSVQGIDMYIRKIWAWRYLPLPLWLAPRIDATERVNEAGNYQFDVDVRLPMIGRVIHYSGWLVIKSRR